MTGDALLLDEQGRPPWSHDFEVEIRMKGKSKSCDSQEKLSFWQVELVQLVSESTGMLLSLKNRKKGEQGRKLEQVVCSQIIHGPHDKVNVELKRLQCWEQRMGWLHLPFFLWSTNHTDKTWNFVNKIFLRIFVLMVLSEIINSLFPQSVFFLMIKLNELWKH